MTNTIVPMGGPEGPVIKSPNGVEYRLVYVTPTLAEQWLDHNDNNRKIRRSDVEKLKRDLTAGKFLENGDTFRFDVDGILIDGQHRATAIYESGIATHAVVVTNLPHEAQRTIDDNLKRTMADHLAFEGEAQGAVLGSITRRLIMWERGYTRNTGQHKPSVQEQFEFIASNPEIVDVVAAINRYRRKRLLPPSIIGLGWWLFSRIDQEQCEEFFSRLNDGFMLEPGNPIAALRDKLIDINAQPGRIPEDFILALTIKTWNAFRDGRSIRALRFNKTEAFPEPK